MGAHGCAAVLVVGVMFGGVLAGCGDDSDDASPVETVADLKGTWSNEDTWSDEDAWSDRDLPEFGPTTLIVTDCAVGEQCGHLERIDDNRNQCDYELVFRSENAAGFNFDTHLTSGFKCAYSPWDFGVLHVAQGADDTIEVGLLSGFDQTRLRRVGD